jgi:diaminohydroxyphosphoribosylaminopyrimidine deaminase/5-amino-6-(5-phosphoribosylamino)uracil reductase
MSDEGIGLEAAKVGEQYMKAALKLAARGRGLASPNPMVGAIVVKKGEVVGQGYHVYSSKDHAEVRALREAGARALGADLYVTLEPCNHLGRTPPCSQAIISSGVKRVFVAVRDPNPDVSGGGVEFLRAEGVETVVGLCEDKARALNEAFFHTVEHRTPFVTLKLALTLDGKIATQQGESKWITGSASRRAVHRLRFENDAILVGIRTVLQDDPSLDVRRRRSNQITKVVLDSELRTPLNARLFLSGDPVVIFHSPMASAEKRNALEKRAELHEVAGGRHRLSWEDVLTALARERNTSLLVEGGAEIAASLIREQRVNRLLLFFGTRMLGSSGISAVGDLGVERLADGPRWEVIRTRQLPPDVMLELRPGMKVQRG